MTEVKFARKFSTTGDIAAFKGTHLALAKLETVELEVGAGDEVREKEAKKPSKQPGDEGTKGGGA